MVTHSSILAWRIPVYIEAWQATVHGVAESLTVLSDDEAQDKQGDVKVEVHACPCFHPPVRLSLLVGALNPFTFKVIINMCDPIAVFFIVFGLLSVGLFLLLCFLPREVPLAFVVKLVWWCLNSLNFCLFGKLLIFPSDLKESLAG